MRNIDSRGVKRGRCECENCQEFEWISPRSNCAYCGYLPVKHLKLGEGDASTLDASLSSNIISLEKDVFFNIESIPILDEESFLKECASQFENKCFKRETDDIADSITVLSFNKNHDGLSESIEKSVSHLQLESNNVSFKRNKNDITDLISASNSKTSNKENLVEKIMSNSIEDQELRYDTKETKEMVLKNFIPTKIPDNIKRLIEAGAKLKETEKSIIIRETCKKMFESDVIKLHMILSMSKILCNEFPFLEGPCGSKHIQVHQKMKSRFKYLKSLQKNNSNFAHKTLCSEMKKETTNSTFTSPTLEKLKIILDNTREIRKKEVNKMEASIVFKTYPALKKSELLLWEFSQIVGVSVDKLRANLMDAIPKILSFIELRVNTDTNIEGQCVHILLNLTKVFNGTKAKADTQRILTLYSTGTEMENIIPSQSEPPRLFAIANNSFNDIKLQSYVDGICAFAATGFDAILLLTSLYWVLNVSFPSSSRLQLSFIAMAVLRKAGIKKGLTDVLKMASFTKILNKVGLTE